MPPKILQQEFRMQDDAILRVLALFKQAAQCVALFIRKMLFS